jgi:4-hydroxybenzoate polyprenyltransferase
MNTFMSLSLKPYITLLRPAQWTKNVFLFAPLVFSKHLFDIEYVRAAGLAFIAFSLVSSSVYILNDVADRVADRAHPIKKNRPVASGAISIGRALLLLVIVALCATVFAIELNVKFMFTAGIYFVLNIAYSFGLKRVILVDVFVIAAGFMLRVLAGAFAISVVVSPWLILCTLFVSVFLAISKRRGELLLSSGPESYVVRPVLRDYDLPLMDQLMTIAAAGMAISYALYTVAERTVAIFGTENLIFTTVFVLFGIFRYIFLVRKKMTDDNPAHLLITDSAMVFNIFAWFLSCVVIIYTTTIKSWF